MLKHCPSPLFLHYTPDVLNGIEDAAVLRKIPGQHSIREAQSDITSVVYAQVVHVHHCFPLDLPDHLDDEVLEGLLVIGPADEFVMHQPLLLTDRGDD